jgi:hypothetical protein
MGQMKVPRTQSNTEAPARLAHRLTEALQRERVVPRFVDSYVIEHGRQALQVHASLYRDLMALLQREALLAMTAHALEIVCNEPHKAGKSKPRLLLRQDAAAFRRKFLSSLSRQEQWKAGEALDFQSDLRRYEELLASNAVRHRRKRFETASHPFVDRCAFILDSSFLENARIAASRTLNDLERLAREITGSVLGTGEIEPKREEHRRTRNPGSY